LIITNAGRNYWSRLLLLGLLGSLILLATPSATQAGIFDCRNLKKRTEANQKSYEISLNRYQNSLADWVNSGAKFQGSFVVEGRFKETGHKILVILNDFMKNEKCVKDSRGSMALRVASVKKTLKETTYISLQYSNPLGDYRDFRTFLE
jgi:hypothetical protein